MTTSMRPLWARSLDILADVLAGVGVVVGVFLLVGAVTALLGASDSQAGAWVTDTGLVLCGPLDGLVELEDANRDLAAPLAAGALVWLVLGWALSAAVRPG